MSKKKHVYRPSDITDDTELVPARKLKLVKPTGKIECKQLASMLLGIKGMDAKKLKKKYLGWLKVPGQPFARAFIRWADVKDENGKTQSVLHPVQVKLAARIFKSLSGEDLDACKSSFSSTRDIVLHRDAKKNPEFMTTTVVREGKKYLAPLFTFENLTDAVNKKASVSRKRKTPAASTKKETKKTAWIKTKRSKKIKNLANGNADAIRELQQEQLTLDDTSIFQAASKAKKKGGSRSKRKREKKLLSQHKKQKKNGVTKNPVVHDRDHYGYLNKQILIHWNKSSFTMHETLSWASRVFTKKKELVMKTPVPGNPYATNFNNFPDPDEMIQRGQSIYEASNPLCFTMDHSWIAEPDNIQWAKYTAAATTTTKKPIVVVDDEKSPVESSLGLQTALVRRTPEPLAVTLPAPSGWTPTPTQEMVDLSFAYETSTSQGGRRNYAPYMLLYAETGELPTDIVSKYRIKNVGNPGMFRVLSRLREWLIQHQYWHKVLQYDPWDGIENKLKNLHFKTNEEVVEKLFTCVSNHLQTSDPVDLYYEFHEKVLKTLENAVTDKNDAIKSNINRARTIFNSLCKIKNPTRDLAASARGFQGERRDVLWCLVHSMIVLKNETSSRRNWRASVLSSAIKSEEVTYDEDSMQADSLLSGNKSPNNDADDRTEWQRNRFTSAVVQIWDDMRKYEDFFSVIQNIMEKRGFKKVRTISDFMAPSKLGAKGQQIPPGLGRARFRFYILNTFNHLFPYGSPESNLNHHPVSESKRQEENRQFQTLANELTKAFGLSSKDYFEGI